jgi:hypothetical protein
MHIDREDIFERRMAKFRQAIKQYQQQEVGLIEQKARDEQ